jgi:hypothetical protein
VKTVKEPKNQILCHEIEPNKWTIASFLLILLFIYYLFIYLFMQTLQNDANYEQKI